jgi:CBS domain-containing protein
MRARELMSSPVLTVHPKASLKEVAILMATHNISGVPVVDDLGHLMGILSESDVLKRLERGEQNESLRGLLHHLVNAGRADPKLKAHTAGALMNEHVITAGPGASVRELLHMMIAHDINRIPIVEGSQVVGIVTREDILRAIARPDTSITADAQWRLLHDLWIDTSGLSITTRNGIVTISGEVGTRSEAELLTRWVTTIEGVVDVEVRNLRYRIDDRHTQHSAGPSEPARGGWEALTPPPKNRLTD